MFFIEYVFLSWKYNVISGLNVKQGHIDVISIGQMYHRYIMFQTWKCGTNRARLNIKIVVPKYDDSHVKDKTVAETVLSLTWEYLYW